MEAEAWLRKVLALQPENAVASRALEGTRTRSVCRFQSNEPLHGPSQVCATSDRR